MPLNVFVDEVILSIFYLRVWNVEDEDAYISACGAFAFLLFT